MQISDHQTLLSVSRPSRYMGNEINAVKKDLSGIEVSMALVFPDVYEVGMSHQGLKILYHILNKHDWIMAERVFSPWTDMENEMRAKGISPSSLETNRSVSDFEIIGFSIQHELSYTNVLTILDLAGIPFLSRDRNDVFPLIIGGGPACFNPEPIADIFDAFVIGDGEEAVVRICETLRNVKKNDEQKETILKELSQIKGLYIPSFFKPHYLPGGVIADIQPALDGYTEVKKSITPDINKNAFPVDQVVPFTHLVHDRLAVEISRGCTRGCRFCQAGMIYRPVRERTPVSILENIDLALKLTGYEEISLLSLSSGDYSHIEQLLRTLMDMKSKDKVAVSFPSLRIDSIDPSWLEQIKRVRKTGFTMAPEAGNDRLRQSINKSMTNSDILKMSNEIYKAGWNLIKLYFMIGLPGEKEQDRKDIINLAREVASLSGRKKGKTVLNISLSTFVPKAHTPFMWFPQLTVSESRRIINLIRSSLKVDSIRVKWNQPELSWLEGIFSRGDRRLTLPLIEAWQSGARFDAWTEHFQMDIWKNALEKFGLSPEFYLYRSRSLSEVLPWDHINSGVTKEYLKREWERSIVGKPTPDCRKKCLECGVCDHREIDPVICKEWSPPQMTDDEISFDRKDAILKKYRLTFNKRSSACYLSHLELNRAFVRSFKRAGLNIVFSKGYHPMPKVSFASALPVGTESDYEIVDIELYDDLPTSVFKRRINDSLPNGLEVIEIININHNQKMPVPIESNFNIKMNGREIDRSCIERFLNSKSFCITKRTKKGVKEVDVRPLVKSIKYTPPDTIAMVIKHIPGPEIKPVNMIKEIFHLEDIELRGIKILKTGQVMG